ncbi:MAG: hypothetical protein ACYTGN_09925 [Planctomycetota bacterium]|jgi:hypothetical protein
MLHPGLLSLLFLVACRSSNPGFSADAYYASPPVARRAAADELAWVEARETALATRLAGADLVFVGRVVHVGRSPGVYSGVIVAWQKVLYEVEEVWKGRPPADRLVIRHVLAEAPTIDPTAPRLNPAIWREGARLVVAASWAAGEGEEHIYPVAAGGPAAARLRALLGPRVDRAELDTAVAIALARTAKLRKEEFRVIGARAFPGSHVWRVTLKPGRLLAGDRSTRIVGAGGEIFVDVDLQTREATIRYGE